MSTVREEVGMFVDGFALHAGASGDGRDVDDGVGSAQLAYGFLDGPAFVSGDGTINHDLERFMANRMNAKTIELDSSHLSIVSKPREVADLIIEAAGV